LKPYYVKVRDWPERIAKSAAVDVSAELRGCSVVGEDCRVGAEAILEDTICGRAHKLLPKVTFRVVLSAPKKGQRYPSQHRHLNQYENGAASPTNANAFSAFESRRDRNLANRKRRIGPQIYRIRCAADRKLVLVKYNLEREETGITSRSRNFSTPTEFGFLKFIFMIRWKASSGSKIWVSAICTVINTRAGSFAVPSTNQR